MILLYAACSSSLSIVNKWAILALPFPGVVTACQFLATSSSVFLLGKLGLLEVEPLEWSKVVLMFPINAVFYVAIFTNGKLLQYSTVETFIAVRSLTPLLVAALDTFLRGEPRPSPRALASLLLITAGALSYARDNTDLTFLGCAWSAVYLVVIVAEMVYAKHVSSTVKLSTWGLVLYQNTIALLLSPIASALSGDLHGFFAFVHQGALNKVIVGPLFLSCFLAVGISFAGWGTRCRVSATQFTVLGVSCKLATLAINLTVWDHHASWRGQLSIVVCILASVAYQRCTDLDRRDNTHKKMKKAALKEPAARTSKVLSP